ncbi:MAG: hypothetical protein IPN95_21195 [Bacteroidetes bacterium]|nr:hypothetical protein [Bacteroidota bacterium]
MRKGIVLIVLMLGWLFGPPSDVQEAKKAYEAKQYTVAVPLFEKAFEQYMAQHAALNFNMGQCWLMQDSAQRAMSWYGKVTNAHAENSQMASWAWNQIGTIFASGKDAPAQGQPQMSPGGQPGAAMMPQMGGAGGMGQGQQVSREKLELALQAFKDALKQDNDNDIARYNYELIKRKLQQQDENQQNQDNQDQQDQQQQQQDQQQQQQDQQQQQKKQPQNQENQGNQGEQGEPKDAEQMSQQEAERILAAMNANEKKFLQQMEKSKKHKTYNHDGPDW